MPSTSTVAPASVPTQLATVKDVKHRVTNDETGTTFLLGSDGLTAVRRLPVEEEVQAESDADGQELTLPRMKQYFSQKHRGRTADQACGLRHLALNTLSRLTRLSGSDRSIKLFGCNFALHAINQRCDRAQHAQ
jgi:hypothetical protein